ncbi:intermembrane phospholipid transport protein YdbH family protein [Croceibacterium atlanticum]
MVANTAGTVTGAGRIDWDAQNVTSSGRFSTDSLDLAAAFGPVRGLSGTVEFTDLLGLTTAPDQTLHVEAIDPGTEVRDGNVTFQLTGGRLLDIRNGTWPFFGGTLTMRPVSLTFGAEEERRYVFEIVGLDASLFIERMELENLSATGIFDGAVPIVFDKSGNGSLENGLLISRPPGGNVSYVGELSYEDLSAMANFAFDALKSLDYRQMQVEMNGELSGEIITRLVFDGVSQGEGAQSNFITRRISRLPFRFDINIRASFHTLMNDLRSLYDPAATDPRELNLIDALGNPIVGEDEAVRRSSAPTLDTPDESVIQPSESETEP